MGVCVLSGFVMSEGAGLLVLESLAGVLARGGGDSVIAELVKDAGDVCVCLHV